MVLLENRAQFKVVPGTIHHGVDGEDSVEVKSSFSLVYELRYRSSLGTEKINEVEDIIETRFAEMRR